MEDNTGSVPMGGTFKFIRGAIVVLSVVVFLGYLMMWCIMPTDEYYNNWVPAIMASTNSTYFGLQGPIMLDFTFPILFIAVLGCIYTHLGKKINGNAARSGGSKRSKVVKFLRRPMNIKCLGIVTWIELAFFGMFIVLCSWYFSAYMHFWMENITITAMTRGDKVWQTKLEKLALSIGLAGNMCLTFLFFPVTRGSSILAFLGITSDAGIKYHIWLGHISMTLFTAHGLLYIIYWAFTHRISEMLKWDESWDMNYVSNLAGEISLVFGLILWATTFPRIRRNMFELFYYTHHLYILFIIFFFLHKGPFFICIMLPGFYLFLIDRFLRFLQSRQKVCLLSARLLACQAMELNFSKSPALDYTPTSTMFLNIPSISKLQWHPFTVISNSSLEAEKISVMIKCEGSWTKKLYDVLSSPSPVVDRLEVSVEGPYGPPPSANFLLRHDMVVMISGGSGITPFISIIRELLFLSSTGRKYKTPKLLLVATFKHSADLSMLDLLLPISGAPSEFGNLDLQIEAYVTREKVHPQHQQPAAEPPRTITFRPLSSDAPITSILGQHNWLWLAAIISSSFIVFLLLLGIITQYYIYPKDLNTMKIELMTRRNVINTLLLCFSIATTATAAFLWNKNKNSKETKQIQDQDMKELTSPSVAPELESHPYQALVKSTKVIYGERPDIRRILLDAKGSSVGALVSGPTQMRRDVAAICSSGVADNLHFESFSFTW